MTDPHRIVIVGGGAGGLELATRAGDRFGRRGSATVTLVDKNETHVWKPLLHEIAAGSMDIHAHQLDYLAQARWHHFSFCCGSLESLDRSRREIVVAPLTDERGVEVIPRRTLSYDTLVIAIGSVEHLRRPRCRGARLRAGVGRRSRPLPPTPDQRLPPSQLSARRRAGPVARGDRRRGSDRRRARSRAAQLHSSARRIRPAKHRPGAVPQYHSPQRRSANPADAPRANRQGRDRGARRPGRARRVLGAGRRSHGKRGENQRRQVLSGGARGLGGGNQRGGSPQGSRRTRNQPDQPARRPADLADDARSGHFRSGGLFGVPARRQDAARAARRAGGASGGFPPARVACASSSPAAARSVSLPRLRFPGFARRIQHDRIADGLSLRQELPCRGLVCAPDVPVAVQDAPVRAARAGRCRARYPGAVPQTRHRAERQAALMVGSIVKIVLGVAIGVPLFLWFFQERLLFFPRPLDSRPTSRPEIEEVTVAAADGVKLRGWLVKGKGAPAPLVIYFGGNAEEVSWLVDLADQFAGWSLLLVNYRGYGESKGKPGEKELLEDALVIHDYANRRPEVNSGRIVAMGRSLGSGVAVHLAAHRSLRGVILVSPYDSMVEVAKRHYPFLPVSLMLRHRFDSLARVP